MDNKRLNMFAHKFEYRSPLWIESDSDISKSSEDQRGGLCSNSDDSIQCQSSTDSSASVNNYLDSKVSCGRPDRKMAVEIGVSKAYTYVRLDTQ